jgi:Exo-beta-D-glucosaminidase Ig-fold domain/Glycosyl hydrolases family 2/Glycosyl hydrolases family 2, TIM barrel domain/Glycosyl hydrolases family 2, sugar binding domain
MRFVFTLIGGVAISVSAFGQPKQMKLTRFHLQSSAVISQSGEILSTVNYKSNVHWFPVTVPSTVLTGLVANRIYPDPYSGLNNMLIPDASDEFNKQYNLEQYSHLPGEPNPWKKPYWYRTHFAVPAEDRGRHFELIFKGINYRAAIWVNGTLIADSTRVIGMFAEYSFDVTRVIKTGEENAIAVKIYPLDYPGLPSKEQLKALDDFYENGGPTGDIGKNVTMLCSVGWDWIPPVRDRNIGIWQPVFLRTTGDVTLHKPQVKTDLPNLPDTTTAKVTVNFGISNHAASIKKGNINVSIQPENFRGTNIQYTQPISIPAGVSVLVHLSPDKIKELVIKNPKLWWPNGYGSPNLYRITISYQDDQGISDVKSFAFGIRTASSKAVEVNKSMRRDFFINGKKVYLLGGAWVPDMMLNTDSLRYNKELLLCKNANVNLVRIWGGGITPPDVFFELTDKYGLMVWSDFWVTGDTQGEFKGSPDWPLQGEVFKRNMTSTIYRIRNHPSLLVWTGGNEGHARKELYDAMRDSVIALDGTRPFIPSSSGFAKLPAGWKGSWPDDKPTGVYSGGPYSWRDPVEYFNLAEKAPDWVFKDETGLPSHPTYNSLIKIIPDLVWDKKAPFPMNNSWGYHDAATGNGHYELYLQDMIKRFGDPVSMEDYCNKMQLMNAMGYQGIFEGAQHKLSSTGGVMLWKLNAAFPSMVWQVYDWYLQPNAGYYFMQNACEPIHVLYQRNNSKVAVVNKTYHAVSGLTVDALVLDIDGKAVGHQTAEVQVGAENTQESISLAPLLTTAKGVVFVVLNLKDKAGKVISHNAYWLSSDNDFKSMNTMTQTTVESSLISTDKTAIGNRWTIHLKNPSIQIALFIRPQVMEKDEEVLPSYWSAGYFSLAPGEEKTITVEVPAGLAASPEIQISGWNVASSLVKLK